MCAYRVAGTRKMQMTSFVLNRGLELTVEDLGVGKGQNLLK